MFVFSTGAPSPSPVLPTEGAALVLDAQDNALHAQVLLQVAGLTTGETAAFRQGALELGLVYASCPKGKMPFVLVRTPRMSFSMAFSLGVEPVQRQQALSAVLQQAAGLSNDATWGLHLELVDRTTHTTSGMRLIGPSPRLWQELATRLLQSRSIDAAAQQRLTDDLYRRFPDEDRLWRRAVVRQRFEGHQE